MSTTSHGVPSHDAPSHAVTSHDDPSHHAPSYDVTSAAVSLGVSSEVGRLRAVLLHRPGAELENLVPRYLEELLFDEIPWLKRAQVEHDGLAKALRQHGVEVFYVGKLVADMLAGDDALKEQFVEAHLTRSGLADPELLASIRSHLLSLESKELFATLTAGLPKKALPRRRGEPTLSDLTTRSYPFYLDPLPSMYFTRDHGAMLPSGVLLSSMYNPVREREVVSLSFLARHHPLFKRAGMGPLLADPLPSGIEGGDILVLGERALAIGLSERTKEKSIEAATNALFEADLMDDILVIQIPTRRSFMHLDTVFTMVDVDKFLIYPGIEPDLRVFLLTPGSRGQARAREEKGLAPALERVLKQPSVTLIRSGGHDPIAAAREQWNDSTNTLAIGPGTVVTYNRNEVTNALLREQGLHVVEIEGSELVRGRGGPRCMTFPLWRDRLEIPVS